MKKLLVVTDAWRPQVNGVVSCYDRMNEQLPKLGYEMSVIHPGLFRTVSLPGYPEIRLALFPRKRLAKMLADIGPDAVHIAVEGPLGLAARALCRKKNIPFTTCYHTHFQIYLASRGLRLLTPAAYAFLRWFHNGGTRTMVATESLKQELEAHSFKNIVLWPLGVDTAFFKRNPSPPLPPLPRPVFVFFSRLASEKSPEEFFQLDLPGTKLVIGDGPERKRLEDAYGKTHRFVGYKRGQELIDWLSLCDVSVFPSRSETFGLVVVETLACGIPVAAHDCQGPRDIITNGVDGYLGEDLREGAMKCLELDREDCRKKALAYTWERSAEAFAGLLAPAKRDNRSIA